MKIEFWQIELGSTFGPENHHWNNQCVTAYDNNVHMKTQFSRAFFLLWRWENMCSSRIRKNVWPNHCWPGGVHLEILLLHCFKRSRATHCNCHLWHFERQHVYCTQYNFPIDCHIESSYLNQKYLYLSNRSELMMWKIMSICYRYILPLPNDLCQWHHWHI